MQPIIVTCYTTPDLDGFASAIAYAEFLNKIGVKAEAVILGEPRDDVKRVMERFRLEFRYAKPRPASLSKGEKLMGRKIILVDASELQAFDRRLDPENVIEIIDHRLTHEAHLFPNAKAQIEKVGAAATLIAEKFYDHTCIPPPTGSLRERRVKGGNSLNISKMSAILLYAAIASNTLNFQSNTMTLKDKRMARYLKGFFSPPNDFYKILFYAPKDLKGAKIERAITGCALDKVGRKKIGIAQLEVFGAEEIVKDGKNRIFKILSKMRADKRLDFIFLTISDVKKRCNFFIAEDKRTQNLLKEIFGVEFKDGVAFRKGLIMRKEIRPMVKKAVNRKKISATGGSACGGRN